MKVIASRVTSYWSIVQIAIGDIVGRTFRVRDVDRNRNRNVGTVALLEYYDDAARSTGASHTRDIKVPFRGIHDATGYIIVEIRKYDVHLIRISDNRRHITVAIFGLRGGEGWISTRDAAPVSNHTGRSTTRNGEWHLYGSHRGESRERLRGEAWATVAECKCTRQR